MAHLRLAENATAVLVRVGRSSTRMMPWSGSLSRAQSTAHLKVNRVPMLGIARMA